MTTRVRLEAPPERYGLAGDYASWSDAVAASTGYDESGILEATRAAAWQVRNGQAAFERDSVVFHEPDFSWPLVSGLMWAAACAGGELNVLDFGGSLGSTYFQNRPLLSALPAVRWNVVEQPAHVAIGKSDFADSTLHFFGSIADCVADTHPNLALLSSVLQYVEHPSLVLDEIKDSNIHYLILDRTPFWPGLSDRLCVQTVPPSIYAASYPSWIFSQAALDSHLSRDWSMIARFENTDWLPAPVEMGYKGFIMSRKGQRA